VRQASSKRHPCLPVACSRAAPPHTRMTHAPSEKRARLLAGSCASTHPRSLSTDPGDRKVRHKTNFQSNACAVGHGRCASSRLFCFSANSRLFRLPSKVERSAAGNRCWNLPAPTSKRGSGRESACRLVLRVGGAAPPPSTQRYHTPADRRKSPTSRQKTAQSGGQSL
jgi:hypothetical protein